MSKKLKALLVAAAVVFCFATAGGTSYCVTADKSVDRVSSTQIYDYAEQFNEAPWSFWYRNRITGELHGVCPVADGTFNAWNNYYENTCAFTSNRIFIGRELKPVIAFTAPESGEMEFSASLSGQVALRFLLGEEVLKQQDEGVLFEPVDVSLSCIMTKGETLYLCAEGGDSAGDWQCFLDIFEMQVAFTPDCPVPVEENEFMLEVGETVTLTRAENVTVTGENEAVSYENGRITALKAGNAYLTLSAPDYAEKTVYVGVKGSGRVSDYSVWDYSAAPRPAGQDGISYFLYDQIACRYLPATCDWGGYINQNKYSNEIDWVVFGGTPYLNIPNNNTYDVALAYRVPETGYLAIDDNISFMDSRDGSGVAVMLNNQRVYPAHLPWGISARGNGGFEGENAARIQIQLYGLEVKEGDWIFLRFNCNIQGGGNLDQVLPSTVFTLTPKEDI